MYKRQLLARPRFGFGALCIFLYVGAEVAIGSIVINYLTLDDVLGRPESVIGWMVSLYWGGAMIGRFIGSALLRLVSPGKILAAVAVGAIALIALSTNSSGTLAAYSLLAIGLRNSIMFPTIFSLACERLGSRAADGSGIINVAIFGGAVIPLATGALAELSGSLALCAEEGADGAGGANGAPVRCGRGGCVSSSPWRCLRFLCSYSCDADSRAALRAPFSTARNVLETEGTSTPPTAASRPLRRSRAPV